MWLSSGHSSVLLSDSSELRLEGVLLVRTELRVLDGGF